MIKPLRTFLVDLFFWAKKLLCVIRQKHYGPLKEIGMLQKPGGYRAVPMRQCHFCGEIQAASVDLGKRFGGRVA